MYKALGACFSEKSSSLSALPPGKTVHVLGRTQGDGATGRFQSPEYLDGKSSSTVHPLRGSRKWLPCSEPQLFLNKMVLTTAASTPVGFVPVLNEIIHVQCLKQSLAQKGSVKTSDSVLTKCLLPYVIGIQFSKVAKAES